jgi:hypothetical protein
MWGDSTERKSDFDVILYLYCAMGRCSWEILVFDIGKAILKKRQDVAVLGVNNYATHLFRFLEDFLLRIVMLTYNKYPIINE